MFKINERKKYQKGSYSQSGEDMIINHLCLSLFLDKPSYLDIGAHHPWHLSNTAYFYERGSSGINVEPHPQLFTAFPRERKRDINLNIGISGNEGNLDFYMMSPSTLSTFSKTEAESFVKEHNFKIKEIRKIKVNSIKNVLDENVEGKFPDVLSIDVEGLELEILKSINFELSRPKIICAESISYSENGRGEKNISLIEFLKSKGYLLYADTNINSIFVLEDLWVR